MKFILPIVFLFIASHAMADRSGLTFRTGLDSFQLDQSAIKGINGLSVFYTNEQGYYFGESIYSAAIGNGGGFFVGGIEIGKYTSFGEKYFWDASLFVGGGGGASQVPGDGLMLRPQIHAGYNFDQFRIGVGASWVSVSGSEISTPAFTLIFSKPLDLAYYSGPKPQSIAGASHISAMKPLYRTYFPQGNGRRGGTNLNTMHLLGAEITFAKTRASETFIQANGVVYGDAEGYADWILGKRYYFGENRFRLFLEFGAGVGGGGAVDTGGGLIVTAGGGLKVEVSNRLGAEFGIGGVSSINGEFWALTPSAKLSLSFGGKPTPTETRWQFSTGLTQQISNVGFRKPGVVNQGSPLMIDTEIDMYVTKNTYVTGHAYTALAGGAGGYQIGFLGLGYRRPLGQNWDISAEALLGAGGGAGVDTRGGLLAGVRFDLDYKLTQSMYISMGLGQVMTLQGGGMKPTTYNIGLKFPFTTTY